MRVELIPHPTSPAGPVRRLWVEAVRDGVQDGAWDGARLRLRFGVEGAVERVVWPKAAKPERADGLWRTTCFEAFVGDGSGPGGAGYVEFNLSPSGRWAGYRFDGPRLGMRAAAEAAGVSGLEIGDGRAVLEGWIEAPAQVVRLGLAAVIEDAAGGLSYRARGHAGAAPDFHDARGWGEGV